MWIMLTKKLPTQFAPPKLSFHWAEPWVSAELFKAQFHRWLKMQKEVRLENIDWSEYEDIVDEDTYNEIQARKSAKQDKKITELQQRHRYRYNKLKKEFLKLNYVPDGLGWGVEHNQGRALGIVFQGERIRVFPDEYNAEASMEMYLEAKALVLHPADTSAAESSDGLTDAQKVLVEHALVDGCNNFQALQMAFGRDVEEAEIPPIGWYEMRVEYASLYCTEEEMSWNIKTYLKTVE